MSMEENIQVVVRIRPIQLNEKKEGDIACVKAISNGKEVQVKVGPLDAQVYRCTECFPNDTSQATFFNECGITQLLDSTMEGYRTCAFAFGQTGAGKTFTMLGPTKGGHSSAFHKEKQNGMVPRSLEYLFSRLSSSNIPFSVKLSCLEIYHEQVFDLFAEEKGRTSLSIRESASDGFYLEGAKMVNCSDYEVACAALEMAMRNRQVGSHDLNSRSSRSHCLTEIYVEVPVNVNEDGVVVGSSDDSGGGAGIAGGSDLKLPQGQYLSRGKASLVDLAGSERLKSTKSTGKVLQEAGFINKSLYVLGKVIAGLVRTGGDLNHKDVPYRDSKLTKLLISSLGGTGRTMLISCVSEAKGSQAETLRTLKFSMSCARIRNKPVKFLDPQEKLILDLRHEIKRLRNENKKLRSTLLTAPAGTLGSGSGGVGGSPGHHHHHHHSEDEGSVRSKSAYSGSSPSQRSQQLGRSPVRRRVAQEQRRGRAGAVAGGAGRGRSARRSSSPVKTQLKKKRAAAAANARGMRGSRSDFTGGGGGSSNSRRSIAADRDDHHVSSTSVALGFSPKASHGLNHHQQHHHDQHHHHDSAPDVGRLQSHDEHDEDHLGTSGGSESVGSIAGRDRPYLVPLAPLLAAQDSEDGGGAQKNPKGPKEPQGSPHSVGGDEEDAYEDDAEEYEDADFEPEDGHQVVGVGSGGIDEDDDMSALSMLSYETPSKRKHRRKVTPGRKKPSPTRSSPRSHRAGGLGGADEHSVGSRSSLHSGSTRRSTGAEREVTQEELDDRVRRYATGPMFFRDKQAEIVPIRETKYMAIKPANNLMRSKEAQRILDLERRVARMEKEERKRIQMEKIAAEGGDINAFTEDEGSVTKKPKKKKKGIKAHQEEVLWKTSHKNRNSPYISHILQDPSAAKAGKGGGGGSSSPGKRVGRVVPGKPKPTFTHPNGDDHEGPPPKKPGIPRGLPVKKRDRNAPHDDEHDDDAASARSGSSDKSTPRKNKPGLPSGLPVKHHKKQGTEASAASAAAGAGADSDNDSARSGIASTEPKSVHQSIEDELRELGLDPITPAAAAAPAPAGKGGPAAGAAGAAGAGSGKAKARPGLPRIGANGGANNKRAAPSNTRARATGAAAKGTSAAEGKLPRIPPKDRKPQQVAGKGANIPNRRHIGADNATADSDAAAGSKAGNKRGSKDAKPKIEAIEKEDRNSFQLFMDNVESVAAPEDRFRSLHEKLEELELSLAKEREHMEDHPGDVTEEAEQRYAAMKEEAKSMRQELIAAGIIISATTKATDKRKAFSADGGESKDSPLSRRKNSNLSTAPGSSSVCADESAALDYQSSGDESSMLVPESVRKMMSELDIINASATPDAVLGSKASEKKASDSGAAAAMADAGVGSTKKGGVSHDSKGNSESKAGGDKNGQGEEGEEEDEYADEGYESDGFEDDLDAVLAAPSSSAKLTSTELPSGSTAEQEKGMAGSSSSSEKLQEKEEEGSVGPEKDQESEKRENGKGDDDKGKGKGSMKDMDWLSLAAGSSDDESDGEGAKREGAAGNAQTIIAATATTAASESDAPVDSSVKAAAAVEKLDVGSTKAAQQVDAKEGGPGKESGTDNKEDDDDYGDDYEDEFEDDGDPTPRPRSKRSRGGKRDVAPSTAPAPPTTDPDSSAEATTVMPESSAVADTEPGAPTIAAPEVPSGGADSPSNNSTGSAGSRQQSKYPYYSGPQTSDTPPLETAAVGYSSKLNVQHDQVRYDKSPMSSRASSPLPSQGGSPSGYIPTSSYEPSGIKRSPDTTPVPAVVTTANSGHSPSAYKPSVSKKYPEKDESVIDQQSSYAPSFTGNSSSYRNNNNNNNASSGSIKDKPEEEGYLPSRPPLDKKDSPTSVTASDELGSGKAASSSAAAAPNPSPPAATAASTSTSVPAITATSKAAAATASVPSSHHAAADDDYEDEFDDYEDEFEDE